MTNPTSFARPLIRRLTPMLGLLLLTVLFVGGAHHHSGDAHHVCVLCTVGHSPAVAADITVPSVAPVGATLAVHAPVQCAPRQPRLETAPSRAPPLA